ncbi:hypothetical protein JYK21_03820 [Ralstonia pickettii]|nr:hypothetical protein [Ralstonia pickettii]
MVEVEKTDFSCGSCHQNFKDNGVRVYTVSFQLEGSAQSHSINLCASCSNIAHEMLMEAFKADIKNS